MSDSRSDPSARTAPRTDSRTLDSLALLLAVLALAAAAAALGWLPRWSLAVCAGPSLFAGAALALVVRWSPLPPDPLKLTAFTLALSPPLAASVWAAWHLVLDGRQALAATAVTFAVLHCASFRRRMSSATASRARIAICVVSAALAAGVACLLLRGNEPRLLEPALTRASVAMAVDRSLPPLHPWLAGEPWPQAYSSDALAAFTMRALSVAPTVAHALFSVLAALLLPALLFFLASSIWSDARRSTMSVILALGASLVPFRELTGSAAALGPFLVAGPGALALALSIAALACAAHALRHGKRPWVGLCALFHGFALCVDFSNAWPAAIATLSAAISPTCNSHARPRVLLALSLACMPALYQARTLELGAGWSEAAPSSAWLANLLPWILSGLLGSAIAWRSIVPDRRAVLVLCVAAALASIAGAFLAPTWTDARGATSLALFALALPTAALAPTTLLRARPLHWAGGAVWVAMLLVGMRELARSSAPLWEASKRSDALLGETVRALEPVSSEASAVDLRAALAMLRADSRLQEDKAVLLACPLNNPYRKTIDLPPTALAACAGIALYGDRLSPKALAEPQYQSRLEELLQLFRDEAAFDPTLLARLEHSGARAVIALMRDEDRAINPPLQGKLERMGFVRWREFGGVQLFIGPRAAAQRYLETP